MKLRINSKLKSNEKDYEVMCDGEINNDIIKYMDNDVLVEIDLVNNIMKRNSKDYELIFNFLKDEETSSILNLKDLEQTINMKLYTIDVIKKEGYYFINYELNDDELFEFELNYEEVKR